jgi:hypothetical protein
MDLPSPLQACTSLLPLLLSPTPVPLPSSLLSNPTRQAHHYLSTPVSAAAYLQPVKVDSEVVKLKDKLVEGATRAGLGWTELVR